MAKLTFLRTHSHRLRRDGLTDGQEITRSTNPIDTDSYGDTKSDGEEVAEGLDPNDSDDCPTWYCGGGISRIIPAIAR